MMFRASCRRSIRPFQPAFRIGWNSALAMTMTMALMVSLASAQDADSVPTPESVLGFEVGADFKLADYHQSLEYFHRLAAASDRVEMRKVGQTSGGLDWYVALVSSPENLANLDRIREISLRLAHARGLDDGQARALAIEGKAVVHIDSGLHATEVAHAQHAIQLAYELASSDGDPEIAAILDRVVLLLWPSMNPDGQNMVVDWYRSNLGTPFEVAPMVQLYQKYVGHDNNRDGYMLNVKESRVTTRALRRWEPQILYNHHQTAPFPARIWIPPFAEPISPHVHPLMWRTVNLLGMAMAQALEERGQEGAMHMGTGFDNWYPGFIDHANNFHNVASFLTETGLYKYATPHFYEVKDFPESKKDLRPGSLYASPWQGGWWRLRDAVDYMLTASVSVLDVAAKYKEDLLYNRYQAGRDVIELYRQNPPYAFFIREAQRDPVAAVEMLRRLAFNGIEIHRLRSEISHGGQSFPAGTWVIAMDQPFANFVRQLFDQQSYPDLREYPEGPPDQPYDVAGWTLPWQMDVRVVAANEPLNGELRRQLELLGSKPAEPGDESADETPGASFDSPLDIGFDSHPVARAIVPPPGEIRGSGPALALDAGQNNSFRFIQRAWAAGARISFVDGKPAEQGEVGRSGTYVVSGLSESGAGDLASQLAIRVERTQERGRPLRRARVGLFRPFQPSMDEGWTRWLLERWEIPFRNLDDAEVRAGELRSRFDVIVLPSIGSEQLEHGFERGVVPAGWAGGLGDLGARALDDFVSRGGYLVAVDQSARYVMKIMKLGVVDVTEDLDRKELFLGGSIVEMQVDPAHPLMTGMPSRAKVLIAQSPVFALPEIGGVEQPEAVALAMYSQQGSPLLSGYLLGEEHIRGYAGAVEVRHGKGRVALLGLRPQWRAQPFGTFRILFNALMHHDSETPRPLGLWPVPVVRPEAPQSGAPEDDSVSSR